MYAYFYMTSKNSFQALFQCFACVFRRLAIDFITNQAKTFYFECVLCKKKKELCKTKWALCKFCYQVFIIVSF